MVVAGVAFAEPLFTQFAEVGERRFLVRAFEAGKKVFAELDVDVDGVGNLLGPRDGVFQALEVRVHLFAAAKIKLIVLHLHPRRIGAEASGVDAQHDVLCLGVGLIDVVAIAGRDDRQPHFVGDVDGPLQLLPLDVQAVVHDLHEVPVAEDAGEPRGDLAGVAFDVGGVGAPHDDAAEFAADATRQADDAFAVRLEDLFVDPRLEVEPFERRGAGELDEVGEAGPIFREQREVIRRVFAAPRPALLEA